MAEKLESRPATLSFTLPISCQICLGKVKQPTICPNQHVFCTPCMDVWLHRNQQCPACRVDITVDNPCKKILGGLNQEEDTDDRFSKPELRRARVDLLFQEYENEIENLQDQVQHYKTEAEYLQDELKKRQTSSSQSALWKEDDLKSKNEKSNHDKTQDKSVDMLLMLTKKLKDATAMYDKIKQDTKKLKQANNDLKDENINLVRENQRLRVELANRSPQRFGRYTVAALESKVDGYEKEVNQLRKALERSDTYIEELEMKLENQQKGTNANATTNQNSYKDQQAVVSHDDSDSSQPGTSLGVHSKHSFYGSSGGKKKNKTLDARRNLFQNSESDNDGPSYFSSDSNVQKTKCDKILVKTEPAWQNDFADVSEQSFNLEAPSPVTPSTSLSKLSINQSLNSSVANTSDNTLVEHEEKPLSRKSARKQLIQERNAPESTYFKNPNSYLHVNNNIQHNQDTNKYAARHANALGVYFEDIDTTSVEIANEAAELDVTLTSDLEECLRLMKAAEKKVDERKQNSLEEESKNSSSSSSGSRKVDHNQKVKIESESTSSYENWKTKYKNYLPGSSSSYGNNGIQNYPSKSLEIKPDHEQCNTHGFSTGLVNGHNNMVPITSSESVLYQKSQSYSVPHTITSSTRPQSALDYREKYQQNSNQRPATAGQGISRSNFSDGRDDVTEAANFRNGTSNFDSTANNLNSRHTGSDVMSNIMSTGTGITLGRVGALSHFKTSTFAMGDGSDSRKRQVGHGASEGSPNKNRKC